MCRAEKAIVVNGRFGATRVWTEVQRRWLRLKVVCAAQKNLPRSRN